MEAGWDSEIYRGLSRLDTGWFLEMWPYNGLAFTEIVLLWEQAEEQAKSEL